MIEAPGGAWSNTGGIGIQFRVIPLSKFTRGGHVNVSMGRIDADVMANALGLQNAVYDALSSIGAILVERAIRLHLTVSSDWIHSGFHEIELSEDHIDEMRQLAGVKDCAYQVRTNRDLFCDAASKDDPLAQLTSRGFSAPTSRPICLACNVPDNRVLCSNFMHPSVLASDRSTRRRSLSSAVCNQGRDEQLRTDPNLCRAGGHACWQRTISVVPKEASAALTPPAVLLNAFDHVNAAWRNLFPGSEQLIPVRSVGRVGDLVSECEDSDAFYSRMSALDDVFKGISIAEDQLPANREEIDRNATFQRWRAALEGKGINPMDLDEPLSTLHAANRLRVGLTHTDSLAEVGASAARLGVGWPPSDFGLAWKIVRTRVAETLAGIARLITTVAA